MPALRAAIIGTASVLLFSGRGYVFQWTGLSFPYLVAPLLASATFLLAADWTYWLRAGAGLRALLLLTGIRGRSNHRDRFRRRLVVDALRRLLRGAAGLALLYGILTSVPLVAGTLASDPRFDVLDSALPYFTVFRDMAPWALALTAPLVVFHAVGRAWYVTEYALVFSTPWLLLGILGALYGSLAPNGALYLAFGFDGSSFLWAALSAGVMLYIGRKLRAVFAALSASHSEASSGRIDKSGRWPRRRAPLPWADPGESVVTVFTSALVGAALIWGTLDTLPAVSSTLLDHQSTTALLGRESFPYLDILADVSLPAAGVWLALVIAWGLPFHQRSDVPISFVPGLKAISLTPAASLVWLTGARLSPLGQGYPLIAAVVAAGLLVVAVAQLSYYTPLVRWSAFDDAATWLRESKLRAFTIGASLAFYGLLLRPVFYQRLWFAPLFEWVVLLAIAVFLLGKMRSRIDRGQGPEPRPTLPSSWARHRQRIEELQDAHFNWLVGVQNRYIESGAWASLWVHFLAVMLENEVPLEGIPPVFQPFTNCQHTTFRRVFSPLRAHDARAEWREGRRSALSEAISKMEAVLASPSRPLRQLDATIVKAAGEQFVREGGHPEAFAVTVVAASWQRGVRVAHGALHSFALVSYMDSPFRWYNTWFFLSKRVERLNLERRQRLAEGAVERAFGSADQTGSQVIIPTLRATVRVSPRLDSPAKTVLSPGWPVEVLWEERGFCAVRTYSNVNGFVAASDLVREPVHAVGRYV